MLTTLWLVLLLLRAGASVPVTHSQPDTNVAVQEPVIIIVK
jgi:hypothetical protein